MLFQYPDPPSTDPGCPSFPERSEGLFAPLSEAIQPGPNALHLDQRAGTFPAHHRSNQAVPSSSSQAAKAEEGESRYYKELTVRCTSLLGVTESPDKDSEVVGRLLEQVTRLVKDGGNASKLIEPGQYLRMLAR